MRESVRRYLPAVLGTFLLAIVIAVPLGWKALLYSWFGSVVVTMLTRPRAEQWRKYLPASVVFGPLMVLLLLNSLGELHRLRRLPATPTLDGLLLLLAARSRRLWSNQNQSESILTRWGEQQILALIQGSLGHADPAVRKRAVEASWQYDLFLDEQDIIVIESS